MLSQLANNWIWVALRGVLAILFGIVAFVMPGLTFLVLVIWFGAYMFVDGLFAVIAAITNRAKNDRWWVMLLEGLLGIAVGILTFFQPGITGVALVFLIAAWAIVTGVLEVIAAIRLRQEIQGEFWLILSGILSVIAGVLLFLFPDTGAVAVVWIIGAYALLFGVMLLVLAFRLRGMKDQISGGKTAAA
jgi:uncharacterized membrane protein HdeD (DUF308 family)